MNLRAFRQPGQDTLTTGLAKRPRL